MNILADVYQHDRVILDEICDYQDKRWDTCVDPTNPAIQIEEDEEDNSSPPLKRQKTE